MPGIGRPDLRALRGQLEAVPERDGPVGVLAAAAQRFAADGMSERAPGLAYYGVLSLFPIMVLGFAVLRIVLGASTADDIAQFARDEGASGAVAGALRSAADTARSASATTTGTAGLIGVVTLLYGASRAFTALGRAIDVVDGHQSIKRSLARRAQDLGWTLVVTLMGLAVVTLALVGGRLLGALFDLFGIHGGGATWAVVRWPTAGALALVTVAVVRWAAPTVRPAGFRLLTPGIALTVGGLALETAGYNVYLATIASYNDTYGAFAGGVILLLWIWLGAIAVLLGAEIDAVLGERRRGHAHPPAGRRWTGLPQPRRRASVGSDRPDRRGADREQHDAGLRHDDGGG
jgi:membrane protein